MEGLLDVFEVDRLADETLQIEPTLLVEIDEHREIAARQAVAVMNETVRREVLEKIDENTAMDELKATLQVVKKTAVEAGRALKILDFKIR